MYTIYQAQQRQRKIKNVLFDTTTTIMQPNIMNDSIRTFINIKQPNIKLNPNNQTVDMNVTTNTKFMLVQLRQFKFWSNYIKNFHWIG